MKSLFVSTAIAVLISGAPAAWAQPDDRGGGKHQDRLPNTQQAQAKPDRGQADRGQSERGRRGESPAQVQAAPAQPQAPVQAQARPEREQRQQRQEAQAPTQVQAPVQQAAPVQAQARPEREQRQQRREAQAPTPVQAPVQQSAPVQAQARPERQQENGRMQRAPQGTFRAQVQPQVQPQIQSRPAPQVQANRNNQAIPPQHVQQRSQWQSNNQDWNRGTAWQRDRNWWRGNDAFRNYSGVRLNFFFAPGFGYYSVPLQYRRHSWHAGDYLPRYFMRYEVNDYRSYGLPRPPNNCRWIWVNNSILLVDRSDRYILDEVSNIW